MKKSASRRPVFAPTPDALAQRGADALRQSRFKEATDLFKQLIRQDPRPEWKQGLNDAYAGRARDLAQKGMFKEAAIVLENTLASDGTIREPQLYLSCLIRQGQHQKARRVALDCVARLPPADAARLTESAAVLSLAAPTPESGSPAGEIWAEQTRAAQAALHAWLQGKPAEEVDRLLGRIPLRSPFGGMRLTLKSLISPSDATEKARGLLAMIPEDSVFAAMRGAAEATLAENQELLDRWTRLRPAQQQFVSEVRGVPQGVAAALYQMMDAERRGPASLFSFLTRRGLPLPEAEIRTACLNLLPAIPERLPEFERRFGPLSAFEHNRALALAAEANEEWYTVPQYWWGVIRTLEHDTAPESRLAQAVVLRHMADLARHHPDAWNDPKVAEDDDVAYYLERSIEADPAFLPATLSLLDRYRAADSPRDWHRATELAAQRFPGNAAVLIHAVDAAVARNAYKKAAGFARQVLRADPINLPVRQRMIELQLAHARKQMRSGRADLAGKALAEAAEWERADKPSGALRVGRALIAIAADQGGAAQDALRVAAQDAGGGITGWFQVMLEAAMMGVPDKHLRPFQSEFDALQKGEPNRETILALVSLLGQKEVRESRKAIAPALRQIDRFLAKGSRIGWLPAEFQTIAELLAHLRDFATLHRYAHAALQREAENSTARFYQILARAEGKTDRLTVLDESELYDMMQEAGERHDFHLFNRIRRLLLGPGATKAMRAPRKAGAMQEQINEDEMAEILESIGGGMPGLPVKEVRSLVNEFGRDVAIDMLAVTVASSPFGEVLSEEQINQICAAMVNQVAMPSQQSSRRR